MKHKSKKLISCILCVFLSAVLLTTCILTVFAEGKSKEKKYISDIKLIYANSAEEAKTHVPEGYTLLEKDLNKGTEYVYDVYEVYFAYSVTTNPDEAITDIKMMNMNGGYAYSSYEKQLKDIDENVRKITDDLIAAIDAFAENYKKGTYGAKAAYRALSVLTVDEAGGQSLADYMLYGKPAYEFYVKLILNVHRDILAVILTALTMAVQGDEGDTWLDRLSEIEDPDTIQEDIGYWDKACVLWDHFADFYEVYDTIDHDTFRKPATDLIIPGDDEDDPATDPSDSPEDPDVANTGIEILYEVAHIALEQYSFGNGTLLSDFLINEDLWEEDLYCLIEVMTPAEYAMMRLCGPLAMILSTAMSAEVYDKYVNEIDALTKNGETCSVWAGVNTDLLLSSIGITDEAYRALAETQYEQELNNDGDSTVKTGFLAAGLVAASGLAVLGVGVLGLSIFAGSLGAMLTGAVVSTAAVVVGITSAIIALTGIAIIVVAVTIALCFLIARLVEWWDEHHPDYSEIPAYMYDYVKDGADNSQFVLYEAVKFQDGKAADVNAWEGKEWHAMYFTKDASAGAPIEADVMVRYGDGRIDEDFAGLAEFGHINAVNLNKYADDDDVGGIFMTYRQADLTGDFAKGKYLSDVRLFTDENAERCKLALKNKKYVLYDYNLTPDSDYFTYLGYKTTNNEGDALTDIRIACNTTVAQFSFAGATYAACGSTCDGGITLYSTRIDLFGTPILSDFLILNDRNAPLGYEPVNLFSGGPALNINLKDERYFDGNTGCYFYFLPSVTYTEGTQYLGGLATIYDVPTGININGFGSVKGAANKLGYQILYTAYGTEMAEAAIVYTTTYNPYRAIYNVTAASLGDGFGNLFTDTLFCDGVGYALSGRYLVSAEENVCYEIKLNREGDSRLYTAGIYAGGEPMTVSQLRASSDQGAPEGFVPVSARLSSDGRAVDLGKAFSFEIRIHKKDGVIGKDVTMKPFYLFISGRDYEEGKYVSNIYISSKESAFGDVDVSCSAIDNAYLVNDLATKGAHYFIPQNLNLADSNNATFIGYTKKLKNEKSGTIYPITNIVLYYAGKTDAAPKSEVVIDRITYQLAGDANIFCKENKQNSNCKRVYLYYTTNPAAGSPILDIKIDKTPILNGWETARTQNQLALSTDMDDYGSSMWFLHMKRAEEDPKYIGEVVIGIGGNEADAKAALVSAGCQYMLEKDLNNNVGAHSDYIYLGYKRTSNPNEAIRDLRTTHDNEVDSFVKNGVTYYKIEGNLNAYTHLFADDIFLYYTKDAKAGTPIISLGTSQHVANWTHGEGNRYVVTTVLNQYDKGSDLNDNCGYQSDYIYLLQTRDRQDAKGVASMIGNGSIIIIVAFVLLSAGAITWICIAQKKNRRIAATVSAESAMDDILKSSVENDKFE